MNNSTTPSNLGHIPCSGAVSVAFTATLCIIIAAALIGNVLVTVTFVKTPNLRTGANYFIVNMAVSDVIAACFTWPLFAIEGMLNGKTLISDPFATFLCKLGIFFRAMSQAVSVLSLVLVAVDRYLVIVFPWKAPFFTGKIRSVFIVLTWIVPLALGIPSLFHSKIVVIGEQTFCRFAWSRLWLMVSYTAGFIAFYLMPLLIVVILHSLIYGYLRRQPSLAEVNTNERRQKQNQKVLRVFIAIVCGFFICWTPLCIFVFLKTLYPSVFLQDKCMLLAGFFYYVCPSLSMTINPMILFKSATNYRQALKRLCSQAHCLHRAPSATPKEEMIADCTVLKQNAIQLDVPGRSKITTLR